MKNMKGIAIIVVFTFMFMNSAFVLPEARAASFAGGSGTEADPYVIMTLAQLDAVRDDLSAHYVLGADIDASDTASWDGGAGFTPIGGNGDELSQFTGSFDGQGYTINDLYIFRSGTDYIGLFGVVGADGVVRNVGLVGGKIEGREVVGGLVGGNLGVVEQSYMTGSVEGGYGVGGLIGVNEGTAENVHMTGLVEGNDTAGSLIGANQGIVRRAYATGDVIGSLVSGGLVGYNMITGTLEEVYATGDVTGFILTGGLVGINDGMVKQAFARGDVSGKADVTGGLVGTNYYGEIINSYSTGHVSGSTHVGGLIGYSEGSTITGSYWDTDTSGQLTSDGGLGRTTSDMTLPSTFTEAGWDFTSVWHIHSTVNDGYPFLIMLSDDLAPVLTVEMTTADGAVYASDTWTNQSVIVSVYGHDDGSGLDSLEYSEDGGSTWQAYTGDITYDTEGTYELMFRATDKAGNVTTVTRIVKISRSGLQLNIIATQDDGSTYVSGEWTKQSVTASVYASHLHGVALEPTTYSLDGGSTWHTYSGALLLSTEGEHELRIKARDILGYELEENLHVRVDQTSPTVSFHPNGTVAMNAASVTTRVDVEDVDSGVDASSLHYLWTSSASTPGITEPWLPFTNGDTLTRSRASGDGYLHIQAEDLAGNVVYRTSDLFQFETSSEGGTGGSEKGTTGEDNTAEPVEVSLSQVQLYNGSHLIQRINGIAKNIRLEGRFVQQVALEPEMLKAAWEVMEERGNAHLAIRIEDTKPTVQVVLPASELIAAMKQSVDTMIEVQLNESRFELLPRGLDLEARAKQLDVDLDDLYVHMTIEQLDEKAMQDMRKVAEQQEIEFVSPVIDFDIHVEAAGKTQTIHDTDGLYMKRAIKVDEDVLNSNWIGVWYDQDGQTFHFVPFQTDVRWDGKKEVVMHVPHNSKHAVVYMAPKTFHDLNGHWAKDDVEALASRMLVNGVTEERFDPDVSITRAEWTVLLVRALGLDTRLAEKGNKFIDVAQGAWYASAVNAAVEAGLIQGYPDGTFRPGALVNREELAVLLDRAQRYMQDTSDLGGTEVEEELSRFTDQAEIAVWAKESVARLVQEGLIQGRSDERFTPKAHTTRAEAVVLLNRMFKVLGFLQ